METGWIVLTLLALLHTVTGSILNVALLKPASTSSLVTSYNASTAVDGNTDAGGYEIEQIIHTESKQIFSWWKVDLEREVQNATVKIYFRTDFSVRRNGVELYTSSSDFTSYPGSMDQLCNTVTGKNDGTDIPDIYNVTCPGTWRYLLIYTNTSNDKDGPVLDFGEVEVYACSNDTYGENCTTSCSSRNCITMSTTCARDGRCPDGCQSGWKGVDCTQACAYGYYGPDCRLLCAELNCLNDSTECNHTNGQCLDGCQRGYTALNCTKECETGTYGDGCSLSCTDRNCSDPSSKCDHVTGQCEGGCTAGYQGTDCKQGCNPGTYGKNCIQNCTQRNCNQQSSECDTRTGQCVDGCQVGWTGVDCTSQVDTQTNAKTGEPGDITIPVAAGAAAALVVIIIIIGVLVFYRRKRSKRPKTDNTSFVAPDDNVYVNVALDKEEQINEVKPILVSTKPKPSSASKSSRGNEDDQSEEVLDEDEAPTSSPYYNIDEEDVIREVAVEDLAATVKKIKSRKGGFEAEYNRLPSGFTATYADSQKEENTGKNKFIGYYPYDYNRVRLTLLPDVPGSDYINASIMHNINETKTYIGAQAPKKSTHGDFWRMIWEQGCARVVMLSGLVEDSKEKCYQYWPEKDLLTTDHFRVTLEDTDTRANYTIRTMKVEKIESRESRRVVQYHYTTWPDHGVPDTLALVNFIWMIRRTYTRTDGPLLVHCSAGIGRTGTYIAVDALLDQAGEEGKVDVQGYVSIMRGQRKNMIQTSDQYECVFNCLVEMTKYGNTSLTVDDFTTLYSNSGMDARVDSDGKTFKELAQMMLAEIEQGSPVVNRMWVDGNQNFIVRTAPSLRSMRGHLLCESPHPGQEKLLWKLVEENNVNNVIVLDKTEGDFVGGKGCTVTFDEIKLTTEERTKLTSDLSLAKLLLQIPIHQCKQKLQILQFLERVSMESLSESFLEHSHLKLMMSELSSRAVLHCSTDRKVAVMFCMLGNLMSEIQEDETVDVLHQVRNFTRIFPDITLTQNDVKLLFDFARRSAHLTGSTYANM